jgi:hypothetical protein
MPPEAGGRSSADLAAALRVGFLKDERGDEPRMKKPTI